MWDYRSENLRDSTHVTISVNHTFENRTRTILTFAIRSRTDMRGLFIDVTSQSLLRYHT